jgi:outer membrane protein OmpA-like peptidoglycan-associated protein
MKKIIAFITIFTLTTSLFAQTQPKHEVSLWGAYGLSTLNYKLSYGDRDLGLGFLGGIGYNYYLNYHWSIGIGAEVQQFTSALDVAGFKDNYFPGFAYYDPNNVAGNPPYMSVTATKYDARYAVFYLNIPLQVKYQLDVWKTHKWYAAANLKFGVMPFSGKYSVDGNYSAEATLWNGETPLPNNLGGAIKVDNAKFETKFNTSIGLETGMKWDLGKNWALYTGIFADYGLCDIRKGETGLHIAQYTGGQTGVTNSFVTNPVLNSNYTEKVEEGKYAAQGNTPFTKRVGTLDAGIKVQLSLGLGGLIAKKSKAVQEYPKPLTADEVDGIVAKNAQKLIDAQKDEFDNLKDYLDDKFKQEAQEVKEGLRLETVWGFDLDKTVIKTGTMNEIASRNLETLLKHKDVRVNLVGNTDDFASDAYNMDLGIRRAQAMKDWLVSKGVAAERLVISSNGKKNPFVANSDEANRRYNRRVEFIIIK